MNSGVGGRGYRRLKHVARELSIKRPRANSCVYMRFWHNLMPIEICQHIHDIGYLPRWIAVDTGFYGIPPAL